MPYGLAYLPAYVVADRGLIEARAKAAGLGEITVTLQHMASGPASSDILLAGDADLAMGGFGPASVSYTHLGAGAWSGGRTTGFPCRSKLRTRS